MMTASRPPSVNSMGADGDPFSALLRPPASETDHERISRLQREADAKRISDSIDEEIKADRERLRKSRQDIRVSLTASRPARRARRFQSMMLSCRAITVIMRAQWFQVPGGVAAHLPRMQCSETDGH